MFGTIVLIIVAQASYKRMYSLEQLKIKSFSDLKEIGRQLDVLPEGDRRCRQSWIDAIAGVNPPLLALLEVSPAGEVQAQKPIIEMVKNAPGVEVEPVQVPKFGRIVYPKPAVKLIAHEEARPQLDRAQSADVHNLGSHPTKSDRDSGGAKTEALGSQEGDRVLAVAGNHQTGRGRVLPGQSIKLVNQSQEQVTQAAENSPGVEVDPRQEAIGPVAENSPGVEVDYVEDILPDCVVCFGEKFIEDTSGRILNCSHCTEARVSQSAIGLGTENSPGVKVEQAQEPIELAAKTSPATPTFQVGDLVQSKTMVWGIQRKSMTGTVLELLPRGGVRVQFGDHISGYGGTLDFSQSQRKDLISVQEPIAQVAKTSPGVSVEQVQEPIEQAAKTSPTASVNPVQEAIEPVAENPPGVEVDPRQELIVSVAKTSTAKVSS